MISFTVRLRFRPDDHDDVANLLRELTSASRQELGCITYVPHFVDGDANSVVIYEQYTDQAALDAHRASTHFAVYAIGGLYQKMLDRSVETLEAVV